MNSKDNIENQFLLFGRYEDRSKRQELIELFNKLSRSNIVNGNYEEGHAKTIHDLFNNKTVRSLCQENPSLQDDIEKEFLDMVSSLEYDKSPFAEDLIKAKQFNNYSLSYAIDEIKSNQSYLKKYLSTDTIDFYNDKINNHLFNEEYKQNLSDSLRTSIEKYKCDWELRLIDEARKEFLQDIFDRVEKIQQMKDLVSDLGLNPGILWDLSKGKFSKRGMDIMKYYDKLMSNNSVIQEIIEMLGRLKKAQKEIIEEIDSTQLVATYKTTYALKGEMVGIHESNDLNSLLPQEVAVLSSELTEPLFYKNYSESKLLTYDYIQREKVLQEKAVHTTTQKSIDEAKGPIIMCVDTSGSMHGTPEGVAKGMCLAMMKIAIKDKRKCYIISFSTDIQTLEISNIQNIPQLIDFLSMSFYGGTDPTPALKESLRMLHKENYKKADVFMISDFVVGNIIPKSVRGEIRNQKKNSTRFYSLTIGTSYNQPIMDLFDGNWIYNPYNTDSLKQIIKNIRSIN